jgi:hypothetical protein
MNIIQFEDPTGQRHVGVVDGDMVRPVRGVNSTRTLALAAIAAGCDLSGEISSRGLDAPQNYDALLADNRVLPPLDHEDPAHCIVAGTGLTHLGSAAARSQMHEKTSQDESSMTDTMKMFKWGLEGGKPLAGRAGVQPEWFYKGDGSVVVRPGGELEVPDFATDHGEEPEVVGLYVIGPDRKPYRLGFAIGNECTDHIMEKKNYLYLAHSKLRACAFGPELCIGALPGHVEGVARIRRGTDLVWEKPFQTGEDNMSHTLANIEYHHFKYDQFLRPGDVHVQFFGTSVASFADGLFATEGDTYEISVPYLGKPLRNRLRRSKQNTTDRNVTQI